MSEEITNDSDLYRVDKELYSMKKTTDESVKGSKFYKIKINYIFL